jgi:uncharacterized protein (UPF0332 family)
MREPMSWQNCVKEFIKMVEADKEKVNSIIKMSSVRLRLLKQQVADEETASPITADYYEIIKELLVALALLHGFKSDNHECLIAFFKEYYPQYEYEVTIIYKLKNNRNKISYNGFFVKKQYLDENRKEFERIINLLNNLLSEKLKSFNKTQK